MIKYNITNKLISGVHDLFSDNAHVPTELYRHAEIGINIISKGKLFSIGDKEH